METFGDLPSLAKAPCIFQTFWVPFAVEFGFCSYKLLAVKEEKKKE